MLYLRVLVPGKDDICDALRVRLRVFLKEEGLLSGSDEDEYDYLPSTRHVVVYDDAQPIATARLLFRDEATAKAKRGLFGLAVEHLLDLSPIVASGLRPAECGRFAILRDYRHGRAIWLLLAGVNSVSLEAGAEIWISVVNAETDDAIDLHILVEVAAAQGLKSPWSVTAWKHSPPPATPSKVFYTDPERELARKGEFGKLRMPHVLALFTSKMGARLMGVPLYLPEFSRCAFPISARLSEVPEQTRMRFALLR